MSHRYRKINIIRIIQVQYCGYKMLKYSADNEKSFLKKQFLLFETVSYKTVSYKTVSYKTVLVYRNSFQNIKEI